MAANDFDDKIKGGHLVTAQHAQPELGIGAEQSAFGDTLHDVLDMKRLGKKQELKRNFNFLATLGFVSIYMGTWEFVLVSLSVGLINGGFAGLFWMFIATSVGYSTVVASLSEMESIGDADLVRAPTSGGQYHWVSEFAPARYQKFLSYSSGWMSTLGWMGAVASGIFIVVSLIEVMINVPDAAFAFTNWQFTLIMLGFIVITIFLNTWGAPILPMLETFSLFGHLGGWLLVIVALWILCPRNSAADVFTSVVNNSGWDNTGASLLLSQIFVLYCIMGSDSVVHISEEVEDAGLVVPRCMWWSYLINTALGIVTLITMLFCIGDLDDAINSDTPYLDLFLNTGSVGVAILLPLVIFLLLFSGNVTSLATGSREIWAFSRDHGMPGSRWLSHLNKRNKVPDNAVYMTSIICAVFCLIQLGSTLAFNIIVSLSLLGLLSTYMISIGCVLLKRIKGEELPPARWSLGRWGLPINAFAFLYSAFVLVLSCFPSELPIDTSSANWAPVVWVAVIVASLFAYFLHGRRHFTPPVMFVEGRREAGVELQHT